MSGETDSILALLEALRRRRSIAAEAFRATLAGLEGVHVQVEPVNADAERAGLRGADLQADVESALREGGMAVFTQTALFAGVPGTPFLHVDVMTVPLDGRYAYSVRLELWQAVRLARRPGVTTLGLTWSALRSSGRSQARTSASSGISCARPSPGSWRSAAWHRRLPRRRHCRADSVRLANAIRGRHALGAPSDARPAAAPRTAR